MFGKCSLRKKTRIPPKFNSSPLKSCHLKRKRLPSDHPFFRGELLNCLQLLGMCISESRLDLFVCFLFYLLHLPSSNPGFWPPKTQARNVLIKVFDHHEENGPCRDVPKNWCFFGQAGHNSHIPHLQVTVKGLDLSYSPFLKIWDFGKNMR